MSQQETKLVRKVHSFWSLIALLVLAVIFSGAIIVMAFHQGIEEDLSVMQFITSKRKTDVQQEDKAPQSPPNTEVPASR